MRAPCNSWRGTEPIAVCNEPVQTQPKTTETVIVCPYVFHARHEMGLPYSLGNFAETVVTSFRMGEECFLGNIFPSWELLDIPNVRSGTKIACKTA